MTRLLAAALALCFAAGTAMADGIYRSSPRIASPAPPQAAPLPYTPFNYTGLYVGGGVGGAIGLGEVSHQEGGGSIDSLAAYGMTGDVRVGFDWQAGALVMGVLGGYQFGEPEFNAFGFNATIEREWYGGGRVGLVTTRGQLIYAGYIYMPQDLVISGGQSGSLSPHNVIAGMEFPMAAGFTLSTEYKYTLPEDVRFDGINVNTDVHELSLRLNYRPAWLF